MDLYVSLAFNFLGFGKNGRCILSLNFEYLAVNFSTFNSYKTTILIK